VPAFKLSLPPSSNALVRPAVMGRAKGKPIVRLVSTAEAREFRELARPKIPRLLLAGPLELYVTFFVPTLASDGGNRLKALEDACNGLAWWDDKQIAEWHLTKVVVSDPAQVGCIVEVVPADPVEHAELARRLAKSSIQERANERAQKRLFEPTPNFSKPGDER
jgi:Holliday junction resolvase RusA-like endonuclease